MGTEIRLCGFCRKPGHTHRRCPNKPTFRPDPLIEGGASVPASDTAYTPPPDRSATFWQLAEAERLYREARARLFADQKEMLTHRHRIEDILDRLRKEMTS